MIKKRETCLYCGEKMESKSAKKTYCSDKCRIYYAREKERGTLDIDIKIKDGEPIIVKRERDTVIPTTYDLNKKSVKIIVDEEPSYNSQWFRNAFNSASDKEELDSLVKLMYKKIVGAWSQGQLKEYAQEIFNDKFNF